MKIKNMDGVRKTFDKWAQNGRAELMEKEHGKNVSKIGRASCRERV